MGALKAMDDLFYVGVADKDLRIFDVVMETERGTTYNAYILKGAGKTVLFETSKDKFCESFFANVEEVCPLSAIDYVVVSHTEPDHSGCLAKLLQKAPNATVLASQTALTFLSHIVGGPFPQRAVAEGDEIDIGGMTLQFFSVPMLHWPDTIFTWVKERGILFTCDCFGCHFADDAVFNDLIQGGCRQLLHAYHYYFNNIMGPYANPHMLNALNKIKDLDIKLIANGHGPVLRTDIPYWMDLYRQWSQPAPPRKPVVAIAYASAYGYTKSLATAIAQGLRDGGAGEVGMFDLTATGMEEARAALQSADGILLGSPTLVGDALPPLYEVMVGLNPIIHRGKFGGAFGSYGWSGEAAHNLIARMEQLHFALPLAALRVRLKPMEEDLAAAHAFGQNFAQAIHTAREQA